MKNFFTTLVLIALMLPAIAQNNEITANEDILLITTASAMPDNVLLGFSGGKTKIEGKKYLENDALEGTVIINGANNEYLFRKMRCNIFSGDLEVQLQGTTKFIRNLRVKSFTLKQGNNKRLFINAIPYSTDMKTFKGYFEVLENGPAKVVKITYAEILSGNYNLALQVGDKKDKITQKKAYYVIKGNKAYNAKRRGLVKRVLSNDQFKAKTIVKEKGLKLKRIDDLKTLVKLYNQATK